MTNPDRKETLCRRQGGGHATFACLHNNALYVSPCDDCPDAHLYLADPSGREDESSATRVPSASATRVGDTSPVALGSDSPTTQSGPLVGAERRHECGNCGHIAQVAAVFGKGYYYWPSPVLCPHCKLIMADCSMRYRSAEASHAA